MRLTVSKPMWLRDRPLVGNGKFSARPSFFWAMFTMARAGTLPSFLYQREIMPGESVDLTGEVQHSEDGDGYETCSSAEANFLLGRVSTFGRAVRFNSRLMFS